MNISGNAPSEYVPGIPSYQTLNTVDNDEDPATYENRFRHYLDRYDGAIAYADSCVGNLLSGLTDLGRDQETTIILHADHGEAFGEEGVFFFHGLSLTKDQIHVPLIVKGPGLEPGRREDPVSLIDIMPYLCEVFDLGNLKSMMGRSFLTDPDPERKIISQILRQLGIVKGERLHLYGQGWFENPESGILFHPNHQKIKGPEANPGFLKSDLAIRIIDYCHDSLGLKNLKPDKESISLNRWVNDFVLEANSISFDSELIERSKGDQTLIDNRLRDLGYID
jgi:hypothetical protein